MIFLGACAHKIRCKQFTSAEVRTLAKELRNDISVEEIEQLIVATNGVPRLLCYAFVDSGIREQIIQDATKMEFMTAIKALPINATTPADVKILIACYFQISLQSVNLTVTQTKNSTLLLANLVHIDTEDQAAVPHCYFHLDESLLEVLSTTLCVPFHNMFGLVSTRAGGAFLFVLFMMEKKKKKIYAWILILFCTTMTQLRVFVCNTNRLRWD